MNWGRSIIGQRDGAATGADDEGTSFAQVISMEEAPDDDVAAATWDTPDLEDQAAPAGITGRTVAAGALALLSVAWVAALAWFSRGLFATMTPPALAQFAATLLAVPAFAAIAWLLLLRTSSAEARRFARTAAGMRAEAAALEQSMAVIGAAIEDRRAQLAEQVRLLTTLGDAATARLASIGRGLSEEIDQADVHARALTAAAATAQDGLATVLKTLPRVRDETNVLTDTIERAGLTAAERAASLDAQIVALAVRGREAENITGGAAEKLAAHLHRMEATSETAGARLEQVAAEATLAVDQMLDRTARAIDQSRKGLTAQGEAMLAMVSANQASLDQSARESAEALAERIGIVEMVIERIAQRLEAQRGAGRTLFDELETGAARIDQRFAAVHAQGSERTQQLAATVSALHSTADAMTAALDAGTAAAERTIDTTEGLLTALDAATREMDETLPEAIARLENRVGATRGVLAAVKPELMSLVSAAESTHGAIEAVAGVVTEQRQTVDSLADTLLDLLDQGRDRATQIGQTIDEASRRTTALTEEAAPRLVEALLRVRETAVAAAAHARDALGQVIPDAAAALETAATAALHRATELGVQEQVSHLATVAETAVVAAQHAAERLERQVEGIEASVALVDRRIEEAQAAREESERDSFARRASLLIESLNSASIDLTRTFAPEISDSAWSAYLKGDRGVFTRRAVRLLDGSEQRDIARLYDDDAHFREQVNRYIHDFEAMLRTILAQRDGSPLGVTLLSSDMGKLYVALAQAIERLR